MGGGQASATGPAGIMIARGAMWNPSIFCKNREVPSFEDVAQSYVRAAVQANATYQNTKWVLASMLAGGTGVATPVDFLGQPTKAFNQKLTMTKSMAAICEMLQVPHDAASFPNQAHTTAFYRTYAFPSEVAQTGEQEAPPLETPKRSEAPQAPASGLATSTASANGEGEDEG